MGAGGRCSVPACEHAPIVRRRIIFGRLRLTVTFAFCNRHRNAHPCMVSARPNFEDQA